ncbi:hypothetical protein GLOIN_2v1614161, partial [Rhizophagus irregularis DAOM 181602=DAOM 197198]
FKNSVYIPYDRIHFVYISFFKKCSKMNCLLNIREFVYGIYKNVHKNGLIATFI